MVRTCIRCGGTSFHYNRHNMRMECLGCGHPLDNEENQDHLMEYDRGYVNAMNHLRAGNWDQTISILQPFLYQYPQDKKLYVAIFRAATEDYQDLLMNDFSRKSRAAEAWNTLLRLNGIVPEMEQYSRSRYEKHMKENFNRRDSIVILLFVTAVFLVFFGIAWNQLHIFLALIFLALTIACCNMIIKEQPFALVKQILTEEFDSRSNPFM